MSPILGIIASQNYPRVTNSYESIATVTVGAGGTSTVTFSSIPSTYKHLQIRGIWQATTAAAQEDSTFYFNGDTTGTNYRSHRVGGNGSVAFAQQNQSTGYYIYPGEVPASNSTNIFAGIIVDILDYADTNKNTTVRTLLGNDRNGAGGINLASGVWLNTVAVDSITFRQPISNAINQYSSFALYGIKG
jgi:hypothetical protein